MNAEDRKGALAVVKKGLDETITILFGMDSVDASEWQETIELIHEKLTLDTAQNCLVAAQSLLKRIPATSANKLLREKIGRVIGILDKLAE